MTLEGKVALVTGASRGVGAAIAKALAEEKATVVINYFKSKEKAEQVVKHIVDKGGNAIAVYADVTNYDDVERMVKRALDTFGKVDVLVNSALIDYKFDPTAKYVSMDTITWENFQQQIDGTLKGAFNCVKALLPSMKERKSGRIINVSTNLFYNPVVTYYDYTTAKGALVAFTRNLAAELGKYGITVNLVAGGLLYVTDASQVTTKEVWDLVASTTPLRRTCTVEEFAKAVLFFASDWSNFVTGQSISVDGGLTMP